MSDPRTSWLTWGTVASMVSVSGALVAAFAWLMANVESSADGMAREMRLRGEIKAEVKSLRDEAAGRVVSNARLAAWGSVQTKRIEVLVLRNRVNDCRALTKQSPLERNACKQYEDEFGEATAAYQRMQKEAMDVSKAMQ